MTKAKNYAAFATKRDGGWTAHYGAPGDEIKSISDDSGRDFIYGTEDEACEHAAVRLVEILNTRRDKALKFRPDKKERVDHLGLAALLEQAGISARDFAVLTNMRGDHLAGMLSGEKPVSSTVTKIGRVFAAQREAANFFRD